MVPFSNQCLSYSILVSKKIWRNKSQWKLPIFKFVQNIKSWLTNSFFCSKTTVWTSTMMWKKRAKSTITLFSCYRKLFQDQAILNFSLISTKSSKMLVSRDTPREACCNFHCWSMQENWCSRRQVVCMTSTPPQAKVVLQSSWKVTTTF